MASRNAVDLSWSLNKATRIMHQALAIIELNNYHLPSASIPFWIYSVVAVKWIPRNTSPRWSWLQPHYLIMNLDARPPNSAGPHESSRIGNGISRPSVRYSRLPLVNRDYFIHADSRSVFQTAGKEVRFTLPKRVLEWCPHAFNYRMVYLMNGSAWSSFHSNDSTSYNWAGVEQVSFGGWEIWIGKCVSRGFLSKLELLRTSSYIFYLSLLRERSWHCLYRPVRNVFLLGLSLIF